MKVIICGANGAMGKLLQERLPGEIAGLVSIDGENGVPKSFDELGKVAADVIIDFSHHSALPDVLRYARENGCGVVVCTTGHTPEEKELLYSAKDLPIFYSGNMSLGIAVLCGLAKTAAARFPQADIEIVEVHHNRKADAPSGTANMIFDALTQVRPEATPHCGRAGEGKRQSGEIGISSLRMGNVVGIHEVHIATNSQTITLKHEAHDRGMFADGAIDAARFLLKQPAGLYSMEDLLG